MVLVPQCIGVLLSHTDHGQVKALLKKGIEEVILDAMRGFKERYAIEIQQAGFDRNHIHVLCRFLPKYSGG